MNKYVLLIEYIKEWGLSLALEHYFFGNKYCFLPKGKLEEFQKKLLYKKIDIINKEYKKIIHELNSKYNPNNTCKVNETIWQYWDGDPKPKVVELCMKSIYKHSNCKRIVLNDSNLFEYYIPTKAIHEKKNNGYITNTHFSDILRVNLLYEYGGAWMDATILFTKEQKFLFKDEYWTVNSEPKNPPLKGKWVCYAISAQKNNKLMYYLSNLFNIYWEKHNTMIDYFLIDIFIYILYCEDKEIKQMIDQVEFNNEHCIELENFLNSNIDDIPKNLSNTGIFKLNWKLSKQEENNGKKTLYRKLLDEYEID